MRPRWRLTTILTLLTSALVMSAAGAQTLVAKPDASGLIHVMRGEVEVASIELSAHGPGWQHAPQSTASTQMSALPERDGLRFTGTLPIPNTNGGALSYEQTVTELPQGLRVEYEVTVEAEMLLSGLQASIYLPVEVFAGSEVMILQPHAEAKLIGLPEEQPLAGRHQIWTGEGARIEVASGSPDAVTVELRAATDLAVQDLRQWEHPVYEIRLPAIMQDPGRQMTPDDRFHLDLLVTFAAPVELQAP